MNHYFLTASRAKIDKVAELLIQVGNSSVRFAERTLIRSTVFFADNAYFASEHFDLTVQTPANSAFTAK